MQIALIFSLKYKTQDAFLVYHDRCGHCPPAPVGEAAVWVKFLLPFLSHQGDLRDQSAGRTYLEFFG